MALLPLACEPLEYLRGRFTSEEKQQDRVRSLLFYFVFVFGVFFFVVVVVVYNNDYNMQR